MTFVRDYAIVTKVINMMENMVSPKFPLDVTSFRLEELDVSFQSSEGGFVPGLQHEGWQHLHGW